MSVINTAVTRTREQLAGNVQVAETLALAYVDVLQSATALAIPVTLAAAPDRSAWVARADAAVASLFDASREAISGAGSLTVQAFDTLTGRLAA